MISNYCPRREPLRNVLMLLPLLFLAGLVSACGSSSTSGSSPTPTSTQGIRGIFHEYALPPSQFVPGTITAGPDGNLWFTEIMQNGSVQAGKIERITPTGTLTEFSLPSANTVGYRYHNRARWQPLVYRREQDCAYYSRGEDQRVLIALNKYVPFSYHNRARWQPLVY